MPYDIIDRQEALAVFHELMRPDSPYRVLRLIGDAKMGKTHLVAKVFPEEARTRYRATCIVIDLRNPSQTIPDFLNVLCTHLGGTAVFPTYHRACADSLGQPRVQVHGLAAALARVSISAPDAASETARLVGFLTTAFLTDLRNLAYPQLVLLFDAVNDATEGVQTWLMDSLLAQLCALDHVRVVVAGRDVPQASASYAACCRTCTLSPITEENEYIAFCRRAGLTIAEQSIRDFARAFGYAPGLFVDYVVPTFSAGRSSHV